MGNDEKEIRQRYSGLTMAELVELHRSARLPAADATIVDEKEILGAVLFKVLFIKACIWSAVYGLLMAYFFTADIRRLFQ